MLVHEGFESADDNRSYPRCVAGERRCPPEDCGGIHGYAEFLQIIADPRHEDHKSTLLWAGGHFDPEAFAPAAVKFDDPKKAVEKGVRAPTVRGGERSSRADRVQGSIKPPTPSRRTDEVVSKIVPDTQPAWIAPARHDPEQQIVEAGEADTATPFGGAARRATLAGLMQCRVAHA